MSLRKSMLKKTRFEKSDSGENGDSERTATFTLDVSDDECGSMENSAMHSSLDQNSTLSVDSMKIKFGGSNSKRHFSWVISYPAQLSVEYSPCSAECVTRRDTPIVLFLNSLFLLEENAPTNSEQFYLRRGLDGIGEVVQRSASVGGWGCPVLVHYVDGVEHFVAAPFSVDICFKTERT
ncbi:hypothetical protein BIW11_10568 [Tropilaelaps mercedesae]|uniref:Uncharacterized protein n=1 Tax=Tropilaelaps mercedesae TaxID=418985 RepID=A0A1V9XFK6_9ACAR|nr:hypothetical protein BIW11_10568 [Tropilaelaps mercedesae]